jgi:hypothetical protein
VLDILGKLPHLTTLDLYATPLSEAKIRQFAQQHPQLDIHWSPRVTNAQKERNEQLAKRGIEVTYRRDEAGGIVPQHPIDLALRQAVHPDALGTLEFDKSEVVDSLFISKHAVSDALLQEVAPSLPDLKTLDIEGTNYSLKGLQSLLTLKQLQSITYYNGGQFTDADIAEFKAAFKGTFEPRP